MIKIGVVALSELPAGLPAKAPARDRLWLVQVVRAVAATMIVVGHSETGVAGIAAGLGRSFERWQLLPWGASLDLFFVVSGFIMVYSSRRLFGRPGGSIDFLRHRIARIAPLYWVCTTAYLAILWAAAARGGAALPDVEHIAASYLFLPIRTADGIFPVLDLGWSLNYEMAFYALFAVVVAWRQRTALTILLLVLGGLALLGTERLFANAAAEFWTRPIIVDFGFGIIVGALRSASFNLSLATRCVLFTVGAAVLAADPLSVFVVPPGVTVDNGWMRVAFAGFPSAVLLGGLVLGPQPRLPGWAEPAVDLGNASYALYLTHPFVLIALEKLVQHVVALQAIPPHLLTAAAVIAALALSLVVSRYVERPLTAFGDHVLGRRRDPPNITLPLGDVTASQGIMP